MVITFNKFLIKTPNNLFLHKNIPKMLLIPNQSFLREIFYSPLKNVMMSPRMGYNPKEGRVSQPACLKFKRPLPTHGNSRQQIQHNRTVIGVASCKVNNLGFRIQNTPTSIDKESINSFLDEGLNFSFISPSEPRTSKPNVNHPTIIKAFLKQERRIHTHRSPPKFILI